MNTQSKLRSTPILELFCLTIAAMMPLRAAGQDGYLAVGGQDQTIELLQLPDLTKIASLNVAPMNYPSLTFLPRTRRLYAFQEDSPGLNTVLDFGACSGGLLHPLSIPAPDFVVANGDESKLVIGSIPGAFDSVSQNTVYIVDPATDTVTGVLGSPTYASIDVEGGTFDPDRNELYLWGSGGGAGGVYDNNLTLLTQCRPGGNAGSSLAQSKIYAPDGGDPGSIDVWDTVTCTHLRTIPLPGYGVTTVRTRAGDKVYVLTTTVVGRQGYPNALSENTLAVIDTTTDQVLAFPLEREIYLGSLVLGADESHAYVSMWLFDAQGGEGGGGELAVVDVQAGTVQHYPLDVTPGGLRGLALIDKLGFECGDGVVETACGEQCDPPGSVVNGTVCDVNCTMGCGNGIVSGTEQCDDGNTNNNDACKNDCTWNVCGDGFVNRGVEQCDDGALNGTPGDACSATCTLPPRTASGQVAAGGTLTTDVEGDGATAGAPVETWVTSPLPGSVSIEEGAPDPTSPSGYAFLGYSVHVTVPSSTSDNPIILVFEIHSSLLPLGSDQTAIEMSKNGVLVPDCDGGTSTASPDPCVASRELLGNGNLRVSIRSSTASYWGGVAPLHDARVVPRGQISLRIPANKLSVTTKALIRVRNRDRVKTGKKQGTPIQLIATNVDCPLGLVADVPDFYPRIPFSQDTVTLAPRRMGTARLRLVASRFAFPKDASPHHCTIKLSAAAQVVDNVDPTPADNTIIVPVTVTTR